MTADPGSRWRRLAIALLAAAALAGCTTPERLEGANWAGPRATPAGREFTPEAANARGIAGLVILRCVADAELRAKGCAVVHENPPGWGFAEGALRVAPGLRGVDATGFGGRQPKPGEAFGIPIMFCPPEQLATCRERLRGDVFAFIERVAPTDQALKAGDCARALSLAAKVAQPAYARWVAERCPRTS